MRRIILAKIITDGGVRKFSVKHEAVINAGITIEDIVTPQKSTVRIPLTALADSGDIVIIKSGNLTEFLGVVADVKSELVTELSIYPISQLFNIEVPLPAMESGVYNYVSALFTSNFSTVADPLAKIPINVVNGIVNDTGLSTTSLTFDNTGKLYDTLYSIFLATGVYCTYDLEFDDLGKPYRFAVTIKRNIDSTERVIRFNNPAIVKGGIERNFTQAQNVNKLVLINASTGARYEFYLLKDNTVTLSASHALRFPVVRQKVKFFEDGTTADELANTAAQELTGEAYNHSIVITMLQGQDNYQVYERVLFYDNGTEYHSIITKTEKEDKFVTLTLGLVRTTLTDKLAKYFKTAQKGGGTISPAGPQGETGRGIASVAVTYQVGSSATTAPTGTWQSTPQATAPSQFLWTKIIITYSSGSPATDTFYSVSAHGATGPTGATGSTGAAGRGISSTVIEYQLHTNGTTPPTGTWVSTPPTQVDATPYLWTRITITYTDAATSISYSVGKKGDKGDPGGTGSAYDLVIRTQAEFDTMIASPTWLGAKSVALIGEFTLSTANNSGIKIPSTVKQIHGFNGAKITVTNFLYNDTTAKGGLWYDVQPASDDYEVRSLIIDCTGAQLSDGVGIFNLRNFYGEAYGHGANGYLTAGSGATGRNGYAGKQIFRAAGRFFGYGGDGLGALAAGYGGIGYGIYGGNYISGQIDAYGGTANTGSSMGSANGGNAYGARNISNLDGIVLARGGDCRDGVTGSAWATYDCSSISVGATALFGVYNGSGSFGTSICFFNTTRATKCYRINGSTTAIWSGTSPYRDDDSCQIV